MSFLDCFAEEMNKTGSLQLEVTNKGATGQTSITWDVVETVTFGFWTDNSIQSNNNDKFVNDKTGTIILDPAKVSILPGIKYKIVYNSEDYFITGNDDIAFMGEVYALNFKKEYE